MQNRRLHNLESRAKQVACVATDRLFEGRSERDLEFFTVHGVFPESVTISSKFERIFVVRGLKTTVILEKVRELTEGGENE